MAHTSLDFICSPCSPVPTTPHQLGLWMFHMSSNSTLNERCTARESIMAAHPKSHLPDYCIQIGGNDYHIPQSCANFTSYEIAAPNPMVSEQWNATKELPEFVKDNFDGDTDAIVVIGKEISSRPSHGIYIYPGGNPLLYHLQASYLSIPTFLLRCCSHLPCIRAK